MTQATTKALSRARAALAALERNAAKSADADATKHRADLLTANLHLIEPGATSVEVDCWLTGEKVVLDLTEGSSSSSPSTSTSTSGSSSSRPVLLDPPDLAALLYRKARKQRRADEGTAPRRAQAEETIALLEGVEGRLAEISALSSSSSSSQSESSSSSSSSELPDDDDDSDSSSSSSSRLVLAASFSSSSSSLVLQRQGERASLSNVGLALLAAATSSTQSIERIETRTSSGTTASRRGGGGGGGSGVCEGDASSSSSQ